MNVQVPMSGSRLGWEVSESSNSIRSWLPACRKKTIVEEAPIYRMKKVSTADVGYEFITAVEDVLAGISPSGVQGRQSVGRQLIA